MSKTPIPDVFKDDSNVKKIILPYNPYFIYAAVQSEDGSCDTTLTCFNSIPKALKDHIHIIEVSTKMVIKFNI